LRITSSIADLELSSKYAAQKAVNYAFKRINNGAFCFMAATSDLLSKKF